MEIDGHVALVTGGASGLSEASARHLAELGAEVAILDRDSELAGSVAASIGGYSQHCDVTDDHSVAAGVSAAMARFDQAAYAASKGAIASMCLPAAREFARSGIRVMAIAPGLFHTPMMKGLPAETTAEITRSIPFPPRLGEPAEYARLVADIVLNPYLNGTVIRLDGAVRLPPR